MKPLCGKCRHAFSLIEVTLALGVSAFCLVTVFALLPIALNIQSTSTSQTAATQIASSIEGDLRATASGATTSPEFLIPIGTTTTLYFTNEGESSATLTAQSRYRAVVSFTPSSGGPRAATLVNVNVSWPAPAAPAQAAGVHSSFVALDRN
jgi:uncharacterized protein (TIGR02598 family)